MRRLLSCFVYWLLLIGPNPHGVLAAPDETASATTAPTSSSGEMGAAPRQFMLSSFFSKVTNEKATEENKHPKQNHILDDDLIPRVQEDDPSSSRVKPIHRRVHKCFRTTREPTGRPRGRPRLFPFGPSLPPGFSHPPDQSDTSLSPSGYPPDYRLVTNTNS